MYLGNISLLDATMSEVLARVAFRLMQIRHHSNPLPFFSPDDIIHDLVCDLTDAHFGALAMWVASFAYHRRRNDMTAGDWKWWVIRRARCAQRNRRLGKPWARVRCPPC